MRREIFASFTRLLKGIKGEQGLSVPITGYFLRGHWNFHKKGHLLYCSTVRLNALRLWEKNLGMIDSLRARCITKCYCDVKHSICSFSWDKLAVRFVWEEKVLWKERRFWCCLLLWWFLLLDFTLNTANRDGKKRSRFLFSPTFPPKNVQQKNENEILLSIQLLPSLFNIVGVFNIRCKWKETRNIA